MSSVKDFLGDDFGSLPSRIRYSSSSDESSSSSPSEPQQSRRRRQGRLLSVHDFTRRNTDTGQVELDANWFYVHAVSFVAWKHIQERSGAVLPSLQKRLEKCDFDWTLDSRDTQFSPLQASREMIRSTTKPRQSTSSSASNNNPEDNSGTSTNTGAPQEEASSSTSSTGAGTHVSNTTDDSNHNNNNNHNGYWQTFPPDDNDNDNRPLLAAASSNSIPGESMTSASAATDSNNNNDNSRAVPPRNEPPRTAYPLPRETEPPLTLPPRTTTTTPTSDESTRRLRKRQRQRRAYTWNFNVTDDSSTPINTTIPSTTSSTPTPMMATTTVYKEDEQDNIEDWQFPFAILGSCYSSVTMPLSILGSSAYELPQSSGSATSAALDAQPLFSRTIPTNAGDAQAVMRYMTSRGVTHMACLYIKDPWGNYYNKDLMQQAARHDVALRSIPYDPDNLPDAIRDLKESGMRYIYAILFEWRPVVEAAYDAGIMGTPDHVWIGAEQVDWTAPSLALDKQNERDRKLAHALHGTGVLVLHVEPSATLEQAVNEFARSPHLQQEFIDTHAPDERYIFDDYTIPNPDLNYYHYYSYDAAISLGLAACETPGLFTGPQLYETIKHMEFEGVTGTVQFDPTTGTRRPDSVSYRIDNVYWREDVDESDTFRFETSLAVVISKGQVQDYGIWKYYDNSTTAPLSIPPMDHDYNLIPLWGQMVGWILGATIMVTSCGIITWTWCHRNRYIVRVSQPIFLCQLCAGTLAMGAAVIPMSMQGTEMSPHLDIACMTSPWLIVLGFVTSFSALFSKTWRLNKLLSAGVGMRRIEVKPMDVVWPFAILMTLNVGLLLGWSFTSPLRYIRIEEHSFDTYGRGLESYGRCTSEDKNHYYFLIPIVVFDMIGVAIATYQSYKARHIPTELSESSYLSLSMASLLETLFLGGPLFFMVLNNPTATFLVGSSLICICCMTILLPVFIPKYKHRNDQMRGREAQSVLASVQHNRAANNRASLERIQATPSKRGKLRVSHRRGSTHHRRHGHGSLTSSGNGGGTSRSGDDTTSNRQGIGNERDCTTSPNRTFSGMETSHSGGTGRRSSGYMPRSGGSMSTVGEETKCDHPDEP